MRLPRSVKTGAKLAVAVVGTVYLWNVATSVILCLAIGRAEFLQMPFLQWWEAVRTVIYVRLADQGMDSDRAANTVD